MRARGSGVGSKVTRTVVYCSLVDCLSSVALYRDLVRRGYRNVRRYSGGLLDWEEAGLPLEGEFGVAP